MLNHLQYPEFSTLLVCQQLACSLPSYIPTNKILSTNSAKVYKFTVLVTESFSFDFRPTPNPKLDFALYAK